MPIATLRRGAARLTVAAATTGFLAGLAFINGGAAHVTVLGNEKGKGVGKDGGVATVTPTGVSCTGDAKAKLIDASGIKHKC